MRTGASVEAALLHCPIRGPLRVRQRAADALTFTEEKHRIDAIRYLLQRRYPRENFGIETTLFRLGRDGRNSFRTDFAIYDRPWDDLRAAKTEERLEHVRVLAEIKRDNANAEQAKATQVRAALQLVPDMDTLGVYWDDVEQRFFYRTVEGRRAEIHEAPISKIPDWGNELGSTRLFYGDLDPSKDLVRIFDEIENAFHPYVVDKVERYTLIQQLLLTKIHDEATHRGGRRREAALDFQDFSAEAISDRDVSRRLDEALSRAASHYNIYLPPSKEIEISFRCPPEALRNASKILAPINILESKVQVIQAFYMKFAKSLYKWDLAQYFTPHEVIDFIVDITNPQSGEHVFDPACGSADFLISAFRKAGPAAENCVWGADSSEQAVQISILNMVLNGDGKTQIANQDSLKDLSKSSRQFNVVLCNPPFGTKIVERRYEVLRKFDMGHKWELDAAGGAQLTEEVRTSQQTGILFAELCVRQAKPGGRIGIILPNGYLGNRGVEYVALREWLMRHAKIVAVVAFPRFTFKKSGADVSASVVVLERREKPLARAAADNEGYATFFGNIESVGWRAGDKKAVPIYLRNEETGELVLDTENEPVLDADFAEVTNEFLRSPSADAFLWALEERERPHGPQSEAVYSAILATGDLNLDPKRHSTKFRALRSQIAAAPHFRLGDVLDVMPGSGFRPNRSSIYRYVEIERIGTGEFDYNELRGWQLPSRAKLRATPGDIFIPHVWGCAGKWFVAAGDCEALVVTNGCTRLRLKEGAEDYLVDLAVGLSSEAFATQMRALATGSDGLAEIVDADLMNIILPRISDEDARAKVADHLGPTLKGDSRLSKILKGVIDADAAFPIPPARKSHCALV